MTSYNDMKQELTLHITAHLQALNEQERRAFIDKLLDFMEPEKLVALHFAYEMTPGQARGSAGTQGEQGAAPYQCSNCGRSLSFPETLFYLGAPYCFEHVPSYDKHEQF